MKWKSSMSAWSVVALTAATLGMGVPGALAHEDPAGPSAASTAVEDVTSDPAESVVESIGIEADEQVDSRWRWVTYYASGGAWLWADPNRNHRKTYLQCGSNKLRHIDQLRWLHGAERIYVTRNCLWNGKDGYTYTIKWQKRVLAGVV